MGLFGGLIVYGFGKRRGRRQAGREFGAGMAAERSAGALAKEFSKTNCANYNRFCRRYGSCDGMVCEPEGIE
jgi:hypothetical protein